MGQGYPLPCPLIAFCGPSCGFLWVVCGCRRQEVPVLTRTCFTIYFCEGVPTSPTPPFPPSPVRLRTRTHPPAPRIAPPPPAPEHLVVASVGLRPRDADTAHHRAPPPLAMLRCLPAGVCWCLPACLLVRSHGRCSALFGSATLPFFFSLYLLCPSLLLLLLYCCYSAIPAELSGT